MVSSTAAAIENYGHGRADQAIVGLGGQFFARKNSQAAKDEFRPYFDNAPVYGHGPSMEDFTAQTPLTVGSPQEVIDRYATMRDHVGDYQRQLFLIDHAGLPLKTVLEQIDILAEDIVPALRTINEAARPARRSEQPADPRRARRRSPREGRRRIHARRRRRRVDRPHGRGWHEAARQGGRGLRPVRNRSFPELVEGQPPSTGSGNGSVQGTGTGAAAGTRRTRTAFDTGVLLSSVTESSGTRTLASGKYAAAQPRAVGYDTTR